MELEGLRASIDEIDRQIIDLFEKRLDVSKDIAKAKEKAGLPVFDETREKAKIESVRNLTVNPEYKDLTADLFGNLFEYSKSVQNKVIKNER